MKLVSRNFCFKSSATKISQFLHCTNLFPVERLLIRFRNTPPEDCQRQRRHIFVCLRDGLNFPQSTWGRRILKRKKPEKILKRPDLQRSTFCITFWAQRYQYLYTAPIWLEKISKLRTLLDSSSFPLWFTHYLESLIQYWHSFCVTPHYNSAKELLDSFWKVVPP